MTELAHRRVEPSPEQRSLGFTLVEMAVAMMLMSVVLVLTMTGMVHLLNPTLQTQAIGTTTSQLDLAFFNLDQQVHYASSIWAPYQGTGGNYDVLFEWTFNGQSNASCSQLQLSTTTGELLERTWPAASPPSSAPGWHIWATNLIVPSPATNPFSFPTTLYAKQELTVTLTAASGTGQAHRTEVSSMTFTALDTSSANAPNTTTCNASWTA